MQVNSLHILRKADKLLADESCWTKGAFARSASGREVLTRSPRAIRFCVGGAITWAARAHPNDSSLDVEARAAYVIGKLRKVVDAGMYNDDPKTTFADVKSWFAKAIEELEEKELRS